MEINVTVTIPGLPEALNNLAAAISGKSAPAGFVKTETQQPVSVAVPDNGTVVGATPTANPTTPAVAPVAAPAATTPPVNNATAPVNTAPSAPTVAAPSNPVANYTIEQLSIAGAALCEQGKMPQLIALLGKYGVQAVTQLSTAPDVINGFAAELKALGAAL